MVNLLFILTGEEKTRLEKFDKSVNKLQERIKVLLTRRLNELRRIARERKLTAKSLRKFRSEDGQVFKEIDPLRFHHQREGRGKIRLARAAELPKEMRNQKNLDLDNPEDFYPHAYYCERGCGWVLGRPLERNFDRTKAFIHEAKDVEHICSLCGELPGQYEYLRS